MASLSKFGVTDSAFEANYANETSATITLDKIMLQKYVALYLNLEVFTDWRRTGFPVLSPAFNNVTNKVIPRRLPYPTSEVKYNSANCPDKDITDPVWWDN